jgi:hypothetical protein
MGQGFLHGCVFDVNQVVGVPKYVGERSDYTDGQVASERSPEELSFRGPVLHEESACLVAACEKQIPRYARNDNPNDAIVDPGEISGYQMIRFRCDPVAIPRDHGDL